MVTFLAGGCDVNVTPPAEAVLFGTWLLGSSDSGQNGKVYVFDAAGKLTEIRTTSGNTTLVERNVHGATQVVGMNVSIRTKGNVIFEGTLNDTLNLISGMLRSEFTIPFTNNVISTDYGAATLTKQ
jgi:YD repeat-containing protein